MKKTRFISIEDFCEKYDLNKKSLGSMKARGFFEERVFLRDGRDVYVDENYFIYKKEAIKRMWLRACDNYYTLIYRATEHKLATELHNIYPSKSIAGWNEFLRMTLFNIPSEKITTITIHGGLYLFLRYSNWIIKRGIA